jgi:hypothetical protein
LKEVAASTGVISGSHHRNRKLRRPWPAEIKDEDVIHRLEQAHTARGGLSILFGNLAPDGAVIKTGGVSPSMWKFRGNARVYDSHDEAMSGIMAGEVQAGEVVVVRYEGPRGGPGMMEMLSPTGAIMGMGLGEKVALITGGRFSGGARRCIGHYPRRQPQVDRCSASIWRCDRYRPGARCLLSVRCWLQAPGGVAPFQPMSKAGCAAPLCSSADTGAVLLDEIGS